MRLNDAGLMVEQWWNELGDKFPETLTESFRIMLNHLHAIFVIVGSGLDMAALFGIGLDDLDLDNAQNSESIVAPLKGGHTGPPLQRVSVSGEPAERTRPKLGQMIQWFKTMTTNEYIRGVRNSDWRPFPGKLWQRDYYEHIVRDEVSTNRIREYVRDNPVRWHLDCENPDRTGAEFDEWLDEFVGADLCVHPEPD
jgi:putative transposase